MIPKAQFLRAVKRFERSILRLKYASVGGAGETASIRFEYREAKRELINLGTVLITGSVALSSSEKKSLERLKRGIEKKNPTVLKYGAPHTSTAVR